MATLTLTPFSRLAFPAINPNKSPNFKFPFPRRLNFSNSTNSKSAPHWRISSTDQFLLLETASSPDAAQVLVAGADASSTVVSALLLVAFVGLAVLTVGVIYIAVTDFLQKRERDRFEKEESAAAQKKRKLRRRKGVTAARATGGPRGFGQKSQRRRHTLLDVCCRSWDLAFLLSEKVTIKGKWRT